MHQFAGQTPDDKIKFLFKVYDLDGKNAVFSVLLPFLGVFFLGDGLIQHKELLHVMRACMEENGMQFSEEQIHDLTSAMFEDADTNNRGAITYEALKAQLEKHGGLLENLSIRFARLFTIFYFFLRLLLHPSDSPQFHFPLIAFLVLVFVLFIICFLFVLFL